MLWHGSRTASGILKQGLRIVPPEVPINEYMFGKGVYLADISSKLNYCCFEESDGTGLLSSDGTGLVLLAEAELGSPMHETTEVNYEESDGTGLVLLAEAELGSPMHETMQTDYDAPETSATDHVQYEGCPAARIKQVLGFDKFKIEKDRWLAIGVQ
jgi:hypothetical protein